MPGYNQYIGSALNTNKPIPFLSILPATLILALLGWGGLVALVLFTLPTLGPRWLFFFLVVLAVTGTFMPLVYFLNRRFPTRPPAEQNVILRQSLWFGLYAGALVWLQLGRMLSLPVAAILAAALLLIEVLVRMREVSRWKPKEQ